MTTTTHDVMIFDSRYSAKFVFQIWSRRVAWQRYSVNPWRVRLGLASAPHRPSHCRRLKLSLKRLWITPLNDTVRQSRGRWKTSLSLVHTNPKHIRRAEDRVSTKDNAYNMHIVVCAHILTRRQWHRGDVSIKWPTTATKIGQDHGFM